MLDVLVGTLSLGALCTAWVLWQRWADRLEPGAGSDTRAAGRCSVPREASATRAPEGRP